MNSSRTLVEMPVLAIVIPSVQIVCVAMALLVGLIRRHYSGGISFEVNETRKIREMKKTYQL
jgi:hypothetical protein